MDPTTLQVGDVVRFDGRVGIGVVKFVGLVHWDDNVWLGIDVKCPYGENDGKRDSVRYFKGNPKSGVFIPASKAIHRIEPEVMFNKLAYLYNVAKERGKKVEPKKIVKASKGIMRLGDAVRVPEGVGIIRYLGTVSWAPDVDYCGLELKEKNGDCDGLKDDER